MIESGGQGGVAAGANQTGATVALVLLFGLYVSVAGCSQPLPEAESAEAQLYARECGICHVAYMPHLLKPAMWEMQMHRMALLRRERGLPPMREADWKTILDYLARHGG